jgi:hypothetical protein
LRVERAWRFQQLMKIHYSNGKGQIMLIKRGITLHSKKEKKIGLNIRKGTDY